MLFHAMIGISELWPVLVIVLLLFGARKLPGLARAMGSSINQFKQGLADGDEAPEKLGDSQAAGTKEGE
jgi:sec-independent protein translocase protein TatA